MPENTTGEPTILIQHIVALREIVVPVLALMHSRNDRSLDEALKLIRDFFAVDRISLAGFDHQAEELFYISQSNVKSVDPLPFAFDRRSPVSVHSWMIQLLLRGEVLMVNDLGDIPPKGMDEKQFMGQLNTLSYMVAPVESDGSMKGFLVLETLQTHRKWTRLEAENLHTLANLLAVGIEQERARRAVINSSEQLLRADYLFRYVFENIAWAVELYDENGYLTDMNPADLELFGFTREQAIGINLYENPNIPEDQKARLRRGETVPFDLSYDFSLASESGYLATKHEGKFKLIRGYCRPVKDAYNQVLFFISILFDDTENYLRDEELKRNLAKLSAAVDTGHSYLWEFDTRKDIEGELYEFNPKDLSGDSMEVTQGRYSPRTLKDLFDSMHPDDRATIVEKYHLLMMQGELDQFTVTYRRVLGDQTCWYTSNVHVDVRNEDGLPIKVLCYTTDITREKEQEVELLQAQEAARLKSAFMGNISHEVRTPLNSIVGFSNFLVDMNSTPETESFREIINKNNSLLLQLVDDILDFSKIELGALDYYYTTVPIKEICEEVISTYEPLLLQSLRLVFDQNHPSYLVHADRTRVRQVLSQLVGNALKYTRKGEITLSYERTDTNYCLIKLKDTGIGLSEADKKNVFKSFYQESMFNQGTGLGLSIAKAIVEAMGGEIGVESAQGQGSVFWFTLPLKDMEYQKL